MQAAPTTAPCRGMTPPPLRLTPPTLPRVGRPRRPTGTVACAHLHRLHSAAVAPLVSADYFTSSINTDLGKQAGAGGSHHCRHVSLQAPQRRLHGGLLLVHRRRKLQLLHQHLAAQGC